MLVTHKDLHKVKFPCFVLPSDDWHETDRVLFLNGLVVDEKNMPGKTLGVRRMQCHRKDMLPLKKAVLTIPDLIQCKTRFFIDKFGKPFVYEKSIRSALKSYRIKSIELKGSASLLWLHGIPSPFTIERPPIGEPEYVRILHYQNKPWLIYDYVRSASKATYRRV